MAAVAGIANGDAHIFIVVGVLSRQRGRTGGRVRAGGGARGGGGTILGEMSAGFATVWVQI